MSARTTSDIVIDYEITHNELLFVTKNPGVYFMYFSFGPPDLTCQFFILHTFAREMHEQKDLITVLPLHLQILSLHLNKCIRK